MAQLVSLRPTPHLALAARSGVPAHPVLAAGARCLLALRPQPLTLRRLALGRTYNQDRVPLSVITLFVPTAVLGTHPVVLVGVIPLLRLRVQGLVLAGRFGVPILAAPVVGARRHPARRHTRLHPVPDLISNQDQLLLPVTGSLALMAVPGIQPAAPAVATPVQPQVGLLRTVTLYVPTGQIMIRTA